MKTRFVALICLTVAFGFTGCGGGGGGHSPTPFPTNETTTVNLAVKIPQNLLSQLSPSGTRAATSTSGAGGICKLKVVVSGAGMETSTEIFEYQPAATFNKSLTVVVGAKRTFKVDALEADGTTVVLTGTSVADVVKEQQNSVTISLEPPKTGVDIGGIIHEITGPPKIRFTTVPAYGSYDNVQGAVDNCLPKDCKVILMIQAWVGWWVKPYANSPYTTVRSDGTWECDYTTGGIDSSAGEIRAYLVTADYVYSGMPDTSDPKVLDMVSVTRSP